MAKCEIAGCNDRGGYNFPANSTVLILCWKHTKAILKDERKTKNWVIWEAVEDWR